MLPQAQERIQAAEEQLMPNEADGFSEGKARAESSSVAGVELMTNEASDGSDYKARPDSPSVAHMMEWVQSLRPHQRLLFYSAVLIILSFCATRNAFYLRFLPCLVIVEIARVLLIWAMFLSGTNEAGLLRDIFYMLGGRVKTEVERTREGGRMRRKLEAGTLGFINQFQGQIFTFWGGYYEKLERNAREKRQKETDNYLKALKHHNNKGD